MIVNIEFLDEEPIENMITSLHYKIDKVVFFGYSEIIKEQKESTQKFLKKYCGVKQVVFHPVSRTNLDSVLQTMRKEIAFEKGNGGELFVDITGGEDLVLAAFGMLAQEMKIPIHMYDIAKDRLIEMEMGNRNSISNRALAHSIELDLNAYIEMQGGIINYRMHKGVKNSGGKEFEETMEILWNIFYRHSSTWYLFSDFIKRYDGKQGKLPSSIEPILNDCSKEGILQNVKYEKGKVSFEYKNQDVRELLWDTGSVLEMYTFLQECKKATDCKVGVHLDWDGILHAKRGEDVLNEIDVLSIRGNIPTFISCKSGNVDQMVLYELETVAERFGGKYARKILVVSKRLSNTHRLRAEEMGIEVRQL